MKPKFQVGDEKWWAHMEVRTHRLVCPDCCGNKYLTVTLGDSSQVTVDCPACKRGFEGSRGYSEVNQYECSPQLALIGRVQIEQRDGFESIEYGVNCTSCSSYCVGEEDLFDTEEEAAARGQILMKELSERALENFYKREKPTHTWGWNAVYHRQCMKRAQQELAYHSEKLAVAQAAKRA